MEHGGAAVVKQFQAFKHQAYIEQETLSFLVEHVIRIAMFKRCTRDTWRSFWPAFRANPGVQWRHMDLTDLRPLWGGHREVLWSIKWLDYGGSV